MSNLHLDVSAGMCHAPRAEQCVPTAGTALQVEAGAQALVGAGSPCSTELPTLPPLRLGQDRPTDIGYALPCKGIC